MNTVNCIKLPPPRFLGFDQNLIYYKSSFTGEEFIYIVVCDGGDEQGIYEYKIESSSMIWNKIFSFPNDFIASYCGNTINQINHKIIVLEFLFDSHFTTQN